MREQTSFVRVCGRTHKDTAYPPLFTMGNTTLAPCPCEGARLRIFETWRVFARIVRPTGAS